MSLRHLTIAKKGLLLLLLPLLYQGLLFGVLFKRQREQTVAQNWVVHTKDLLTQLDRVENSMLELQGNFRGYVITGVKDFAAECDRLAAAVPPMMTQLRETARDSTPGQQERVERIGRIVEERLAWNRSLLGLLESGDWEAGLARVRALEGQRIMSSLRVEVDAFQAEAERTDRERLQALRHATEVQDRLLVGGLVLSVVVGIGSAIFLGLNITRRVELLAKNASRFTKGEPLIPIPPSNDEIGQLDRHFHEVAEGLLEARDRERHALLALERRNTELEHVNRDLDHKNEENEMFVYSVSHDLRSPLVNLQGFSKELGLARDDLRVLFQKEWTESVRKRAELVVDRDVTESIHYIQTAVMRLSGIIDALLRLSRAGRIDYQMEMVDLQTVVQRIATALRGSILERKAELVVGKLPPAWADPTAIEQVFANLLSNAVAYLDPNRPGRIEVGFCETPPEASNGLPTYFVRDNGLGIAAAYLPKVFAIFQRLHAHAAKGEGVGLTLVRRMVERHGGNIWVESREGEGSTFYVSLPPEEQSPLVVAPRKESTKLAPAGNGPS